MKSNFTEKLRDLLIEYKFAESEPLAAIYARAMEKGLEIAMQTVTDYFQRWAKKK